jgi:hypothetical protein
VLVTAAVPLAIGAAVATEAYYAYKIGEGVYDTAKINLQEANRFQETKVDWKPDDKPAINAHTYQKLNVLKAQLGFKESAVDNPQEFTRLEQAIKRRIAVVEGRAEDMTAEEQKLAPPGWLARRFEDSTAAQDRDANRQIAYAAAGELKAYGNALNAYNAREKTVNPQALQQARQERPVLRENLADMRQAEAGECVAPRAAGKSVPVAKATSI